MSEDPVAFRALNEIGIIYQLAATAFERAIPAGMTLAQFTVLNHFVRLGKPRSPSELARAFEVSKATITSTLGRLSEKGFVAVVPDEIDGRVKRVTITPAGRRMRDDCVAALAPRLQVLERDLGSRAFTALLPQLRALREALDGMREAAGPE